MSGVNKAATRTKVSAEPEVDQAAAFKKAMLVIYKEKPAKINGKSMKPKELKAAREAKIADLFEERLQTMLMDGILKQLEDAKQPFDESALQELQKRLFNARSSKDLIQWPVARMEKAWNIQHFVDDLLLRGKKSADEVSELTGSVFKGAMAYAKTIAAVAELIDGATSVFKEEGIQVLKGDLPNLIKLKVLENAALMQKSAVSATAELSENALKEAVEKLEKGLDALHQKGKGGTRQRKRKRRRTQRYRARFTADDFF